MKKVITIIISVLVVASISLNVWQYNNNNGLKVQTELLQNELDSIEENINSLNTDISAKDEEITTLSSRIADLETEISTLKAENTNLSDQIKELKVAKEEQKKQKETEEPPVDSNAIAESLGLPAGIPGGLESLPRGTGDGNGGGTMILE